MQNIEPFNIGHVVIILKDENNNLNIIDPQINKELSEQKVYMLLLKDIYFGQYHKNNEKYKPKILRIDDKEFNWHYIDDITTKKDDY